MARPKSQPTFEHDLESLEKIVHALEEGGLPLDDSLKQFEQGIQLYRRCEKALTEAEKKIEMLTQNQDGQLEAQPFDENSEVPESITGSLIGGEDDEEDGDEEDDGTMLF